MAKDTQIKKPDKKQKQPRSLMEKQENRTGFLFISPYIIGFLLFTLIPLGFSLISSFHFYDMTSIFRFIGTRNYQQIFTRDNNFRISLYNTFYYVVFSVPSVIIVALGLALLMNMKIYLGRYFRTIYYLPSILSGVAVYLLWQWIFDPSNGLLNNVLSIFGIGKIAWLQDPMFMKPALIIMRLWSTGGTMVLFLAALQGVPVELYDAAKIDGAVPRQIFFKITLPMISPTMLFIMITAINGAFQIFDSAYIMSTPTGGPGQALLFYNLNLYNVAIKEFKMGYASALAWVLFVIILIFTLIQMWASRKWVHYETDQKK